MLRTAAGIVAALGVYLVEITDYGLSREVRIARTESDQDVYFENTSLTLEECIRKYLGARGTDAEGVGPA